MTYRNKSISVQQLQEREFIYCPYCGIKSDTVVPAYRFLPLASDVTEREAIGNYFYSGFEYV